MSSSRVHMSLTGAPMAFDALDRRRNEVHLQAPAETAAEQGRDHVDVAGLESRRVGGGHLRRLLHLRADVEIAASVSDVGGAIHGFHRRVREHRQFVHRRKRLAADLSAAAGSPLFFAESPGPAAAAFASSAEIAALSSPPLGPGSQTIFRASRALRACQK